MEGSSWAVLEKRRRQQERRAEPEPASPRDDDFVTLVVPRTLADAFVAETRAAGVTPAARQLGHLLAAGVRGKGDAPPASRR